MHFHPFFDRFSTHLYIQFPAGFLASAKLEQIRLCPRLNENVHIHALFPASCLLVAARLVENVHFVQVFSPRHRPSKLDTVNYSRFSYRRKAAEKPLLPIAGTCSGRTNAASGAYSRVCKQTGPSADAFSPPSAQRCRHRGGINEHFLFAICHLFYTFTCFLQKNFY